MNTITSNDVEETSNNNNNNNNDNTNQMDERTTKAIAMEPADFETAINAAGFGIFNILLLFVSLFVCMATVLETATVSYILPTAECDLMLTLLDKGVLNAVTYSGMICSAIAWGYLADTKGRKQILVFASLADFLCVLGAAMSQNKLQLMIFKFLGGFVINGPFAVLMSYINELHSKAYRPRIVMLTGLMFACGSLLLPILALIILPQQWNWGNGSLNFYPWQLFLALNGIPSLLGGSFLVFFPESPKFLMSQGRNEEALKIFQKIYAINTKKPKDTYPIKELAVEIPESKSLKKRLDANLESAQHKEDNKNTESGKKPKKGLTFKEGLLQLRPLFTKPYLFYGLQVYLLNVLDLMGQNTARLWVPQLFASMNEYEMISNQAASMCDIVEYSVNKTLVIKENLSLNTTCEVHITVDTYLNNFIVASSNLVCYIFVGWIVKYLGIKKILVTCLMISGTCGIALYLSMSSLTTVIFSAMYVSAGSISSTSIIGASAHLFPTSLRTMVVSLVMMFGRTGSVLGNILFPTFMEFNCILPFAMISAVMYGGAIIAAFLPNISKKDLK